MPLEHHLARGGGPRARLADRLFRRLGGFVLATLFYGLRMLDAAKVRSSFAPLYVFLRDKWYFDELYAWLFVQPVLAISIAAAWIDRQLIDGLPDGLAGWPRGAVLDDLIDRYLVDGAVNLLAALTFGLGLRLRAADRPAAAVRDVHRGRHGGPVHADQRLLGLCNRSQGDVGWASAGIIRGQLWRHIAYPEPEA